MALKIVNHIKEVKENQFLDITLPILDWIVIKLTENKLKLINSKTKEIEKIENNFNIEIFLEKKLNSEDKELSKKIQDICKLSFPPYYWREKCYKFYTTEKTGSDEIKKEILINLFKCLKQYELENKILFDQSNQIFEIDSKNKIKLETTDLIMKFNTEINRFVVLAKDFIGSDKYITLRSVAEYSGNLINKENISSSNLNNFLLSTDFFAEDIINKKLEKKAYFIINPLKYATVKKLFEIEFEKKEKFINEQKNISSKYDLSIYNIEEDNVFDLKIKFIPENQCFEFYGKGYFDSVGFNGIRTKRSLLGNFALNFIYTQDKVDINKYVSNEIILDNKEKIELEIINGGSKREKNIRVPASEWLKIKKIKESFTEVNKLWSRPIKTIKINNCDISDLCLLSSFPVIFFDKQGKSYLVFNLRKNGKFKDLGENSIVADYLVEDYHISFNEVGEVGEKKKRNFKFSQTLKTIPISFEEAKCFMESHPFADFIKKDSIRLNTRVWGEDKFNLTEEDRLSIFNKILLHAEIQSKELSNIKNIKSKKFKI